MCYAYTDAYLSIHTVLEELGSAARQYASAGAVDEYAQLLQQWSAKGYKSEADLFICRAVLHLLSINK
jgi:Golgi to ER traffic protein 4